ncbi:MAG TPA: hypothetical protein VM582_07045, partial [Candidatus Thermoplasmatota archaeon]|nr:hypothetical protein [Candidatus Thermoplasmatota archaeon]
MKGAYEPDTIYDLAGWNVLHPDTSSGISLYLNGFGAPGGPLLTTVNPNVAAVRSSFGPAPYLPVALFGIWRDCNRDGYVGTAEHGLLEYRSTLLLDDAVCPRGTPPPDQPWRVFNDGEWVLEYIPVGYDDVTTAADSNPYNVND